MCIYIYIIFYKKKKIKFGKMRIQLYHVNLSLLFSKDNSVKEKNL